MDERNHVFGKELEYVTLRERVFAESWRNPEEKKILDWNSGCETGNQLFRDECLEPFSGR